MTDSLQDKQDSVGKGNYEKKSTEGMTKSSLGTVKEKSKYFGELSRKNKSNRKRGIILWKKTRTQNINRKTKIVNRNIIGEKHDLKCMYIC